MIALGLPRPGAQGVSELGYRENGVMSDAWRPFYLGNGCRQTPAERSLIVIIFNFIGLGMAGAGFLIAYGVGLLLGNYTESVLMMIAGPLLFVGDILYRRRSEAAQPTRWWYHPRTGGQLFFAPIWAFGLLWMMIGTIRWLASATG
jgi:hypothetical protein